ncbi:hypothetical protein NDU88_006269 [Pleurodeles waltl]|uniref:Uncharacterized protein n=1 Tax=Pleurodeles waltl TaxID=8319 RepID=A0AAV7TD41_PLEWA|nr:hypothetical protein NDU88_006269 [Pleurodeles waltl]
MSPGAQTARISSARPSMPPTFLGRAARVSASVFGLPVSGPLNHGAGLPRSRPFSALLTARVVARWATLSGALDGVAPRALHRQPQSGPTGRGQYAVRSAVSAGGRFPLRVRSGSQVGVAPGRLQALPNSGFLRSRSQGATKTPLGQSRIEYGNGFGRMTEGSGALLECDRHLDRN